MKNRESLKLKLENTDDEKLKQMLNALATASGMNVEKKNALLSDIPRLRRLLTDTSDEQLSQIIASLGGESLTEILRKLNG